MGMKVTDNPLQRAFARSKPLLVREVRVAPTADLLNWLEILGSQVVSTPKLGEPPEFILKSRQRVRTEIERRCAGADPDPDPDRAAAQVFNDALIAAARC